MFLKCSVCGKVAILDEKDAYKEGWDFPPLSEVTTCGDCPSAPGLIGLEKEDNSEPEPGPRSGAKAE